MRFRHFMIAVAAIILISMLVKREEDKITKKVVPALAIFAGATVIYKIVCWIEDYLSWVEMDTYVYIVVLAEVIVSILLLFIVANICGRYFISVGKPAVWIYLVLLVCTILSAFLYYVIIKNEINMFDDMLKDTDMMTAPFIVNIFSYQSGLRLIVRILIVLPAGIVVAYHILKYRAIQKSKTLSENPLETNGGIL